jgi:hypothetical protein
VCAIRVIINQRSRSHPPLIYLDHGAYVTAQYHSSPGPLKDLQNVVDDLELVQADVTEEKTVEKLFKRGGEFFEQEVQVLIGVPSCWFTGYCN